MALRKVVEQLVCQPLTLLDSKCVFALEAFFIGYKQVDASAKPLWTALINRFRGPNEAGAASLAALCAPTSGAAFDLLIDELKRLVHQSDEIQSVVGPLAEVPFIDQVREPIRSGRYGLVFGEPTVSWMYNYSRGYLTALERVSPDFAKRELQKFSEFEAWIQDVYGVKADSWHALIRVFEGPCARGLERFLVLWDDCFDY